MSSYFVTTTNIYVKQKLSLLVWVVCLLVPVMHLLWTETSAACTDASYTDHAMSPSTLLPCGRRMCNETCNAAPWGKHRPDYRRPRSSEAAPWPSMDQTTPRSCEVHRRGHRLPVGPAGSRGRRHRVHVEYAFGRSSSRVVPGFLQHGRCICPIQKCQVGLLSCQTQTAREKNPDVRHSWGKKNWSTCTAVRRVTVESRGKFKTVHATKDLEVINI